MDENLTRRKILKRAIITEWKNITTFHWQ